MTDKPKAKRKKKQVSKIKQVDISDPTLVFSILRYIYDVSNKYDNPPWEELISKEEFKRYGLKVIVEKKGFKSVKEVKFGSEALFTLFLLERSGMKEDWPHY